jgi:argininosuccinate lyase
MGSSVALLFDKTQNQASQDRGDRKNEKKSQPRDLIHYARLGSFSSSAAKYTSSIDIDNRILDAVIDINRAHIFVLFKQKIISRTVAKQILSTLNSIPKDFELNEGLEDVHMNVEDYVISKIGKSVGGMMNLAKSRNDQVATALRISLRKELLVIADEIIGLQQVLLSKARETASEVMPGYTHLQRAQPVTVGHHLLSYEETLERDLERVLQCYSRVNKSPLGAGALASSGFSLDRRTLANLLGFEGVVENSIDAVSARDFAIESIYVCAQIMSDLSRLAEEMILWTSKEFAFAEISDEFASTSSMMPQKKNAIVPEVARARSAQVAGDLVAALGIVKALPLSYNLDLQELTRNLWSTIEKTQQTLFLFSEMTRSFKFNKETLRRAVDEDETVFATEVADYLVEKFGISFRDAHSRVGALVKHAEVSGNSKNPFTGSSNQDISSILGVSITKDEISRVISPEFVLSTRKSMGSPNPELVKQSCRVHTYLNSKNRRRISQLQRNLLVRRASLFSSIDKLVFQG